MLVKATTEKVLGVELEEHIGYSKNSPEGQNTGNNRNGTFEPEFVKKHQTRLTSFDDRYYPCIPEV